MHGLENRLRELREKGGWRQEDLALKAGVSHSAISNWENGKARMNDERLHAVADALSEQLGQRITIDYLLGRSNSLESVLPSNASPMGLTVRLPVFGTIAAGEPSLAEQRVEGWEDVPVTEIKDGDYFVLAVKGNSMSGVQIMDGDKVFVRQQPTVDDWEIAVVMVNGEDATLKTVCWKGDEVMLIPENPEYGRISVKAESVRILGKAMWVKHDLNRRSSFGDGPH